MRQIEFLAHALRVLERLQIPYVVVGSYASTAWGEPRMTRDVDIVIALTEGQVDHLCDSFPDHEYYVSRAAANEAVRHGSQFNVIHPASGNKIDFLIAGQSEWVRRQLCRRRKTAFEPSVSGYVASPEDVIIGKLLYYRDGTSEKHVRDIRGILKVSGQDLDRDYIASSACQLGVHDLWTSIAADIAN